MKLYRWLARGIYQDRVIEPGEEILVPDHIIPGAHMLDVGAATRAELSVVEPPTPVPDVLPNIMDLVAAVGAAHPRALGPDGRVFRFDTDRCNYVPEEPAPPVIVVPTPASVADTPEAAAARRGAAVGETTSEVGDGEKTADASQETPPADTPPPQG